MFTSILKVQLINNSGKKWQLLEDFTFNDDVHGIITVPAGFSTDFASVPRIPVVFELVGDRGHAAATLHDYLYSTAMFSRHETDLILLRALRSTKVGKIRSYLMYYGVRSFGWMFYNK